MRLLVPTSVLVVEGFVRSARRPKISYDLVRFVFRIC